LRSKYAFLAANLVLLMGEPLASPGAFGGGSSVAFYIQVDLQQDQGGR
jgi:hypothetical protein